MQNCCTSLFRWIPQNNAAQPRQGAQQEHRFPKNVCKLLAVQLHSKDQAQLATCNLLDATPLKDKY